ncbi:MAG: MaoC family dehydratase [Dehalococcoidia bacterium]
MVASLTSRYFDDVEIGDEFAEEQTAGKEDVLRFFMMTASARLTGAGDDRFVSEEAGKRLGAEGPIIPGVMSFALLSRLITDWMGVDGQLDNLDVSFRRPIAHGDTLRLVALVTDTDAEAARVKLDVYIENARRERPLQGTAIVGLPRRQ